MTGDLERANGHHSFGTSKHGPDCKCQLCTGFLPGNQASVRHGAYSSLRVGKRGAQLAAEIRDVMPIYEEADEVAVRLLATTLARVEFASIAMDRFDEMSQGRELASYRLEEAQAPERLRRDLRSWIKLAAQQADALGLTPVSRGKLGVSVAVINSERARQSLMAKYGSRDE